MPVTNLNTLEPLQRRCYSREFLQAYRHCRIPAVPVPLVFHPASIGGKVDFGLQVRAVNFTSGPS